ncbi:MAG TPA: ATP-binding protein [Kiloniellaceae bacterium]|nr:ATP-binding protein [Kiloniellaceae bacterium]
MRSSVFPRFSSRRRAEGGADRSLRGAGRLPASRRTGRAHSSLSRRHDGTGLGLPLCSRFAEAHGGSLAIESVLGEGTVVTLRLPAGRVRLEAAA